MRQDCPAPNLAGHVLVSENDPGGCCAEIVMLLIFTTEGHGLSG
jgi:hypothetical protein